MSVVDHQLVVKNESEYGTAVSLSSGASSFEFNSENIAETFGRTEGDPLRKGTWFLREDRHTPYFAGAAGAIELDVMTKGFGWWLKHMFGAVSTGSETDSTYAHSFSIADLLGLSFTAQVGRPLHPSGTVQPFTYEGGKVAEWELANSVEGNLVATMTCDFQQVATGTTLATPSYPTCENLTWAGGVVTIGGTQVPLTEVAFGMNNGLNVDRRYIDGSTDKKEPTGGRREGTFSCSADFAALSQRAYAAAATAAGNMAEVIATWTGPTLAGTSTYPSLVVTANVRLDEWAANATEPTGLSQTLSGVVRFDGTDSIDAVYTSTDATPV